ncbi:hypothetical protein [Nocardioides jishulii]|uniref:DUF4829 domain-containing protein n=1 Tax=Nocardioides jishulii TaxID=2575440 RepID=A0A4U2YGY5_9ACTN|nr:hypothetical protein [Nocardioides jishulii]QCX26743.1 hypothetical protein FCL41_03680 [Nocardioides jishulii]TKI60287.1 hypothetical protein FC770_15870 [Nocardioides jishulii]
MNKWWVALALALVAAGGVAAWWLAAPHQDREVALPADDATPGEVVAAYLDALDAGDCDTAVALREAGTSQDSTWCADVASLSNPAIESPRSEDPAWSGRPATDEVVSVPVRFDLEMRALRGDGSLGDGSMTWGYRLTRSSDDGPWRIFDQGHG